MSQKQNKKSNLPNRKTINMHGMGGTEGILEQLTRVPSPGNKGSRQLGRKEMLEQ